MNCDDGESDQHGEHEDNDQTENRLFDNKFSLSDILAGQTLATGKGPRPEKVPGRLSCLRRVGTLFAEALTIKRVFRDVQLQW